LLKINGRDLRDALDLRFYESDEVIELLTRVPGGDEILFDILKEPDESLGLVPEPDKVRRCTNACPFCFVKGNPKIEKLRAGLYIKDDDYRLSFLFGHYVTLTNLRDEDWERIFEQRLTPLYVSVHATEPAARLAMLKNPRSADIGLHLDRLAEGGIRVHAQVVLCPGLNDGAILQQTIDDLYGRGEAILSLSIVPVGLTSYNQDRGVRSLAAEECRRAIDMVERVRARATVERDTSWAYAADELFLLAGLEVPGRRYFDDVELVRDWRAGASFSSPARRWRRTCAIWATGSRPGPAPSLRLCRQRTDCSARWSPPPGFSVVQITWRPSVHTPILTSV
jgi:putative radical SAM enzyme (TIGR03279 family)